MPKGLWLEDDLVTSDAFMDLSGGAVKVLLLFMRRQRRKKKGRQWVTTNNGEIEFPYNQAKRLHGIAGSTFARNINELMDHGFLSVSRPGVAVSGTATQYKLDSRYVDWGTDRFKEVEKLRHPSYRPGKPVGMAILVPSQKWDLERKTG